jgi:integrase/recombinase XerD
MVRSFVIAMERRGLRRSTIVKRAGVVRGWLAYLERSGGAAATASRQDVEAWLDLHHCGARARYTLISHLHMFYVWLQREDLTTSDPTVLIERPRLERRLPRPARKAAVDLAILEAPADVALMLSLMVDAGLRCCEVAVCVWADVDLDAGVIYVHGKGGHDRVVGVPARLRMMLAAMDSTTGPVHGRYVSACRVSQIICPYLRDAGVGATAHQLRHLYATRLYAATDGNLLAVQQALGHASVTSTQIYARVDPAAALDAARRLDAA